MTEVMLDQGGRCGFVALIGAPNAGKSTLLNALVGSKIAIVTHKVQTTRSRLVGVAVHDDSQMIFVDTPGIFEAKKRLERAMVAAAWEGANDADIIIFMVDATRKIEDSTRIMAEGLKESSKKAILVLNKIDLVPKGELLPLIGEMSELGAFTDIVPISALKDDGMDGLVKSLLKRMPEGPQYFPEGSYTDCPESFLIGEIIREKAFRLTRYEVPYSLAVMVESLVERENGMTVIKATIIVEKDSQKKIVIGKSGGMLKEIGSSARREFERRLNCKVFLSLFVKVKANWRESDYCLKEFGYGNDSY